MSEPAYVWGCDPSTQRLALAAADEEHVHDSMAVEFDTKLKTGARLADIYDRTAGAAQLWAERFPPMYVFVEQPAAFGRQVEPELYYATGAVQAGLYAALCELYPHPVEVRTMPIAVWRKLAFGEGNGNAKKAQYLDLIRPLGYEGDDLDECAAWGVSRAGALQVWPPQLALA